MSLDWVRLVRAAALIGWAAFFDWLWLSDRAGDYVGPRTSWIVPFGGIVLTVASVLYVRGSRRSGGGSRPASAAEVLGLVALLAPLLLVAAAPTASLGALAVDRKRSSGDQVAAVNRLEKTADISLYDIAGANASEEYARDNDIRPGLRVGVDGLVSKSVESGTLELSRFLASCCAADAMPFSVDVQPPADAPEYELSQWLQVSGTLERIGGNLVIVAEQMKPIEKPSNPYGL
jgi:uncharacterized repeat protein (TIGR03943 family)